MQHLTSPSKQPSYCATTTITIPSPPMQTAIFPTLQTGLSTLLLGGEELVSNSTYSIRKDFPQVTPFILGWARYSRVKASQLRFFILKFGPRRVFTPGTSFNQVNLIAFSLMMGWSLQRTCLGSVCTNPSLQTMAPWSFESSSLLQGSPVCSVTPAPTGWEGQEGAAGSSKLWLSSVLIIWGECDLLRAMNSFLQLNDKQKAI